MNRPTYILFPLILFVASHALIPSLKAETVTRLFAHWGDIGGNGTLLRLGGLDRPDHFKDLNPGGSAIPNEPVMDQIRNWYAEKKEDAAGAGLYVSPTLFGSRRFGQDLLIVEMETPVGVEPGFRPDIKELSDAAKTPGQRDKLPLMSTYNSDQDWIVISRLPRARDGVRIRFRPPTAEDVNTLWRQMEAQPKDAQFATLAKIAAEINGTSKYDPVTRSTDIVFQRLLFDNSVATLLQPLGKAATKDLASILNAYLKKLPEDERTKKIYANFFEHWKEVRSTLKVDNPLTAVLLGHSERLPADKQVELASWFLNKPTSHSSALLHLLANTYDSLPGGVQAKAAGFLQTVHKSVETWPSSRDFTDYWRLSQRVLGVEKAKAQVGALVQSLTKNLYAPAVNLTHVQDELGKLTEVIASLSPELRDVFEKAVMSAPKVEPSHPFQRVIPSLTAMALVPGTKNEAFRAFANQTIRSAVDADIRPFESQLELLVETRGTGGGDLPFVAKVEALIQTFSQFGPVIAGELEALEQMMADNDIPWARLIEKAKQASRHDAQTKLENANRQLQTLARNTYSPMPDETLFRNSYLHSVETIPGSTEYSLMARTFNLVDPLLVSEDLRLKNASRPFERFNESIGTGTETQPAWENFNQVWESLAVDLWIWPTIEKMRHFEGSYTTRLLFANDNLMSNRVDASKNQNWTKRWDRTKYTTEISDEDWKAWDLEKQRSELSRYFKITKAQGKYQLQFLEYEALQKTIPDLDKDTHQKARDLPSHVIARYIENSAMTLSDPIARATRILYLTTRLHPAENGNGRTARAYAAAELARAGYPMPVGFPTTDFMMTEKHLELEVRKSIKLGEFWQRMLWDAHKRGVAPENFFQQVFKGSSLEGFLHISPRDPGQLEKYVTWLEGQTELPDWGKRVANAVESRLQALHGQGRAVALISEMERARLLEEAWRSVYADLEKSGATQLPFQPFTQPLAGKRTQLALEAPLRSECSRANSGVKGSGI